MTRARQKKGKRKERPEPPPSTPRPRKVIIACVAATLALLAADLGSKQWAEDNISADRFGEPPPVCEPDDDGRVIMQRSPTEPLVLIEDYLELRYAENCGAAFGIMRSGSMAARAIFVIAAVAASIALMVMFVRGRGRALFATSVPLVVSGALGNLVDRIRYGYVVDFIKFNIPDVIDYPTFNIADCGITVGVILLVLDGFREPAPKSPAPKSPKSPAAKEPTSGGDSEASSEGE